MSDECNMTLCIHSIRCKKQPLLGCLVYRQLYVFCTAVVVTGQPTYVPLIVRYGEGPIMVTCPHCHATVTTSTHYTVGTFAWLICVIILLLGCVTSASSCCCLLLSLSNIYVFMLISMLFLSWFVAVSVLYFVIFYFWQFLNYRMHSISIDWFA